MTRPKDIYGNDIEMGPWYWARNQRGKIAGVVRFAAKIGSDEVTLYINDVGYSPEFWTFVRCHENPEQEFRCAEKAKDLLTGWKEPMRFMGSD